MLRKCALPLAALQFRSLSTDLLASDVKQKLLGRAPGALGGRSRAGKTLLHKDEVADA